MSCHVITAFDNYKLIKKAKKKSVVDFHSFCLYNYEVGQTFLLKQLNSNYKIDPCGIIWKEIIGNKK